MTWYYNDLTAATGAPSTDYFNPHGYAFEAQGTQHVVYRGGDDSHVHELWWDGNGWHHNDLTAATGAPLASFVWKAYVFAAQGTQHVLYQTTGLQDNDGHIHELWWDSNGWHHNELTAAAGAPLFRDVLTAYIFAAQGTQHVIYLGFDIHVHELWWDSNSWHHNDLTAATNAPAPQYGNGTMAGYAFEAQATQHVIYVAADHLIELWWDSNAWHYSDLTAATGAPLAYTVGTGYVFATQGTQHITYVGTDRHVHELWWDGNGWHHNDLTAATGAPPISNLYSVPAAYVFDAQGTQHVLYQAIGTPGTDGHIHELWWDGNGWHHNDLTAATGAPLAHEDSSPLGYVFAAQGSQHVVYSATDGRVIELYWS